MTARPTPHLLGDPGAATVGNSVHCREQCPLPQPFRGTPRAHLHCLPGWPLSLLAIKTLKQLAILTCVETEACCGGALTGVPVWRWGTPVLGSVSLNKTKTSAG